MFILFRFARSLSGSWRRRLRAAPWTEEQPGFARLCAETDRAGRPHDSGSPYEHPSAAITRAPASLMGEGQRLKRSRLAALSLMSLPLLAVTALPASAASHAASQAKVLKDTAGSIDEPLCQSNKSTCVDAASNLGGEYVGHDEPSVLFKSGIPGSGNDMTYVSDAAEGSEDPAERVGCRAAARGTSSCGRRSGSGSRCATPSPRPSSPRSAHRTPTATTWSAAIRARRTISASIPGNAFMELQFYGPGYVPQFEGFGCTATPVLRGDDHRQPRAEPEHRRRQHHRLQQLRPRRGRAHQLGLHHQERGVPGARRTRCSPGPSPTRTSAR